MNMREKIIKRLSKQEEIEGKSSDTEARAELRKVEVNNSILNVAKAITQGKILPIMLFYHCFMKINK